MNAMKKNYFLLFLVLCELSYARDLSAQSDVDNVIKINPVSLIASNFTLFYERRVSDCSTLQIGLNFMVNPSDISGNQFFCYGFTPEYRYYLSHASIDIPAGGYIAPWVRYRHLSVTLQEPSTENPLKLVNANFMVEQYSYGFVLGYQCITEHNFVLNFFSGPFLNHNECYASKGRIPSLDLGLLGNNGLGFRIGAGIGYAF
jgi:hypothetical protein